MQRRNINPWNWQDQYGFSQSVEVTAGQSALYCAGQTSVDPEGRPLHGGDIENQLRTAMDNLEKVLATAGYALAHVVRLDVFTTDLDRLFASYGAMVGRLMQAGIKPAMTVLGVSRLAFPELMIEIEATAVK